jgi:hypothetical protein
MHDEYGKRQRTVFVKPASLLLRVLLASMVLSVAVSGLAAETRRRELSEFGR